MIVVVFSCNIVLMGQIRDSILKRMLKLGLTIYQVSKMVEGKLPRRTVYAFLTGEKDTGTETASIVMEALGLTVDLNPNKRNLQKGFDMKTQKPKTLRGRVIAEWEKAGKPKWTPRELLGICLLIDLEFRIERLNPAAKFRNAVESKNYNYLITWAQGLKFSSWK